jgi:hypothetical protein
MRRLAAAAASATATALLIGASLTSSSSAAGVDAGIERSGGADQYRKFVDHHGLVLRAELVYLIYWGKAWTQKDPFVPTAEQVTGAVRTMLASTYMTALAQYRAIGRGRLRGSTLLASSEPPTGFGDDDVDRFVRDQISIGTIPGPDTEDQTLYAVVMPPGVKPEYEAWDGEHNTHGGHGHGIHYAWFASPGALDGLTAIMSHEIVETATDPEGSGFLGVRGTCSQEGWCEVADICGTTGVIDGVTVSSYWSDEARECVVPTTPRLSPGFPRRSGETLRSHNAVVTGPSASALRPAAASSGQGARLP